MLATINSASDFDPSDYGAGQRLSQGLATIIHAKAKTKPRPSDMESWGRFYVVSGLLGLREDCFRLRMVPGVVHGRNRMARYRPKLAQERFLYIARANTRAKIKAA